ASHAPRRAAQERRQAMIASWMAYAGLLGVLVTLAAVAAEHVAVARRWPARLVWIAALGLSIAWPLGESLRRYWHQTRTTADVMPFAITVLPAQVITAASGPTRAEIIDRILLVCWIAASAFLLLRLASAVIGLRRARSDWRHDEVDGVLVRLAPNEGP